MLKDTCLIAKLKVSHFIWDYGNLWILPRISLKIEPPSEFSFDMLGLKLRNKAKWTCMCMHMYMYAHMHVLRGANKTSGGTWIHMI